MSAVGITRSFVIHLGLDAAAVGRLEADARSQGMLVIPVSLAGIVDRASLVQYLAETFMFPHETGSIDAAIDLISDLEWFGDTSGYLLVVSSSRGLPEIVDVFISMLPNIVDRWRSQGVPFVVAVDGKGARLLSSLNAANKEMKTAGDLPWAQPGTGPVDVIVHEP